MEQTMRLWEPILTGSMRVKAEEIVDTLASRLSETKRYNTFGDHLSMSIFYSHLNRCSPQSCWSQCAEYHACKSLELAALYRDSLSVGLFWGISGLAWGILYGHDAGPKVDTLDAFNTFISQHIQTIAGRVSLQQRIFWGDEYDLIYGISGAGTYLLRYMKAVDHPEGLDQALVSIC